MASLVISCLSQKGGVGKSTLARLIARTYAVSGWTVKIADFNTKQLTSVVWGELRKANLIEPKIMAEAFDRPTRLRTDEADLVVADGRPDSDQSSMEIARVSDLIVVPTGLPLDDLQPQLMFANELVEKGIDKARILFVLNKTTESKVAVIAARNYLRTATNFAVCENHITSKTSYQRAQNHGYSLSEVQGLNTQRLEETADLLAAEIVAHVTKLGEEAA
ncbi:ParA family protein [Agrobacterium sp. CG674]